MNISRTDISMTTNMIKAMNVPISTVVTKLIFITVNKSVKNYIYKMNIKNMSEYKTSIYVQRCGEVNIGMTIDMTIKDRKPLSINMNINLTMNIEVNGNKNSNKNK